MINFWQFVVSGKLLEQRIVSQVCDWYSTSIQINFQSMKNNDQSWEAWQKWLTDRYLWQLFIKTKKCKKAHYGTFCFFWLVRNVSWCQRSESWEREEGDGSRHWQEMGNQFWWESSTVSRLRLLQAQEVDTGVYFESLLYCLFHQSLAKLLLLQRLVKSIVKVI